MLKGFIIQSKMVPPQRGKEEEDMNILVRVKGWEVFFFFFFLKNYREEERDENAFSRVVWE